jgi:hypothetical protein
MIPSGWSSKDMTPFLMGSTAVLVDVLSKPFKARNTGVPETIRIQWKKGEGADVYTLSDLTKTEHVTHAYTPRKVYETELGYANLKITYIHTYIHTSSRLPLFLPTAGRNAVQATATSATTASDQATKRALRMRKLAFSILTGLEYGVGAKADSQHQFDSTAETCAVLTNGWACDKNSKKLPANETRYTT